MIKYNINAIEKDTSNPKTYQTDTIQIARMGYPINVMLLKLRTWRGSTECLVSNEWATRAPTENRLNMPTSRHHSLCFSRRERVYLQPSSIFISPS
eukprot:m.518096 g.518096  ORF g.518096 m.518096 type:complete len:96 (+) comp21938_c0_seq1:536-823(+)